MYELNEQLYNGIFGFGKYDILFDEYKITDKNIRNNIKDVFDKIDKHIIPENYPKELLNNFRMYPARSAVIERIGFTLVSKQWIKPLAKWIDNRKCLEILAGCGSITYALKEEGIDIKATDNFSWNGEDNWNSNNNYWTDIENIDAIEAVKKYGKDIDIIIISWAYMDDTAYRILQAMRKINPNCIMLYIGESYGGCTADDTFFDSIKEIEDDSFDEVYNNFQRWNGIHDYPMLVK